ncbi:substrate-binding domain-containing protein [Ruania halotolerans]|uniref:substrate-binding domain-containing protein n=1 Tax=Ruania halotolerans TaxID=2897773 RepID=UPI001E37D20B|nr:GntR family transcriptional regulator [Ruania halotolerans]UFU06708.1 GntR family transcriptional regulator [Ruania halotolerans]
MPEALYAHVHAALRERIRNGSFPVGERLPSQAELTEEFSVSAITLKRALDMLRDDGYVVRRPRIGTVVVAQHPEAEGTAAGLPLVGYVVPNFDDAFGTRLLGGMLDAAVGSADVIVATSHGDPEREEQLIEQQLDRGIDALVLLPSSSASIPPAVATLVGRRFPQVIVDRTLTGVPVSTITSDNVAGGRIAVEHLTDLGHQHLALALSPSSVSSLDERRRGFVAAHAARHVRLDPDLVYSQVRSVVPGSHERQEDDAARFAQFLTAHPEVTGVVAAEYHAARIVLQAAHLLQRRVPDDLSVVCFDAPPEFVDAALPLTHLEQDQHRLGERALELALAQVREPGAVAQEAVPMQLILGRTTAAARR